MEEHDEGMTIAVCVALVLVGLWLAMSYVWA